ncbi:MAG: DUF1152 domain-containing protein [Anaerolineae bacterium]|nr:DUF1152 domain-containing protein [Anaerolineae bacterium]
MRLNLPVTERLAECQNILVAGMGGGFDVFCGLPLYFELREQGKTVHLANYSFSFLSDLHDGHDLGENLVGVNADMTSWYQYFPERHLAQWFRENRHEEITIWCFHKTGVRPLIEGYQALIERFKIDAIMLIDGGVDSLMRGNEAQYGTLIEDSISLCAVDALKGVKHKFIACVGLGAELEMTYAHVFENIAELNKEGGFLGSCSLIKQMECFQWYEQAVEYTFAQPSQEPSVINASVLSAVRGEYGNYHLTWKTQGSKLWISPLMSIYWFFDLHGVAKRNLLMDDLYYTDTLTDAARAVWKLMQQIVKRKETRIPLT